MGTALGLIAHFGRAGLPEFDEHYNDERVADFRHRVSLQLDPEVDRAYPERWIGKVSVETNDGRTIDARVDEPKGDPGNTLTREELEDKAIRLADYTAGATPDEMRRIFDLIYRLDEVPSVGMLFP